MFNRSKGWIPTLVSKPKNPRSLEHLKFLYNVLCKNQTVTEQNRGLLVETNRSIAEILIWGDQNDSSVFDFFLEKNMLSFFLRYMRQKCGRLICVQLLQTLNILFDNISNETSLYYLLSNNHINAIIEHRFDFSDEEVMAYYISFLKTLSLKLNKHTIHFFYNEHTNDFALYTEAIKFFNHSETMVRIAVRTITLNVYKVHDAAMLRYIRDRTAAPYFSNLVWFVGIHILDLDTCVRNDADHQSRDRLASLVAEHLDHLHYVNDILSIDIDTLNDVLTDQLLNRLLIPLYVYSLTKRKRFELRQRDGKKHVSSVVSLFLLSQVFLIIKHTPLVRQLAEIILQGDVSLSRQETSSTDSPRMRVREFSAPDETLEEMLDGTHGLRPRNESVRVTAGNSTFYRGPDDASREGMPGASGSEEPFEETHELTSPSQNSTDEEKMSTWSQLARRGSPVYDGQIQAGFSLENRPYLESVFNALECTENDYEALFALCLLYAMGHNDGIHQGLLDSVFMPTDRSETKDNYNVALVERLIRIITLACQHSSRVRLTTLELSIRLLKQLVYRPGHSYLQDRHLASIENARECSTQLLRNFYKSDEIFLDMYEDEYRDIQARPLNVEYLTMDASILLTPTGTPLTGIEFNKRLPCGEVERARRAIRVFFLVRDLSLTLLQEVDSQLPLTKDKDCVKVDNILDLNNSDLIACTIVTKERKQERRFLVIDACQMILVEPDIRRLGWGIVTFVGFLQNIEVTGDKEDSRSLHITVHKSATSHYAKPVPQLSGRFIFDDHIRCMAAKQRLTKGRMKARQQKMQQIERLLDIPTDHGAQGGSGHFTRTGPIPGRSHPVRVSSGASIRATQSAPQFQNSQSASAIPIRQHSVTALSQGRRPPQQVSQGRQASVNIDQEGRQHIHVEEGRQSMEQNTSSNASVSNDTDDEVEVAEEATSEMAFQTLNQAGPVTSGRYEPGLHENSPPPQEIPLEDLSRKHKSKKKQLLTRARLTQSRLSAELQEDQSRSHSQSPSRKHSDTGKSKLAKPRGRSTSLTAEGTQTESRSRSGTPERRVHSESSPLPPGSTHLRKHRHKHSQSTQVQTHLTLDMHKAHVKDPDNYASTHVEDTPTSHNQSPKTLLPSQGPTVSLLAESTAQMAEDSPKLVPPAEVGRTQTLGADISKTSIEHDNTSIGGPKSDPSEQTMTGFDRPALGLNVATRAVVELSQANVEVEKAEASTMKGSHSATEQLTKLAQMVQHYKFDENINVEQETSMADEAKH